MKSRDVTDASEAHPFLRYMDASLELNAALIEWMAAAEKQEAGPWERAQVARKDRNAAADLYVALLLEEPLSAKAEYASLKERLRQKCGDDGWGKMMEHLQALDETFDAQYRRAWLIAATKRYSPALVFGLVLGGALVGTLMR
jgi:hypothetical protein